MSPSPRASRSQPDSLPLAGDTVTLLRSGDERAFRTLFDRYYRSLFVFAWRMLHNEVAAEEIVQDVLLAVWEQRESWAPVSVEAYLFGAVRNRVLSLLERQRVAARYTQRSDVPRTVASADDAQAATELDMAIRRAIELLPERCRTMFLLNRESGLSYAAIAVALGVSIKTVETQIGRALTVFRRELRDWLP